MNKKMYLIASLLMVSGTLFGAEAADQRVLREIDIINSRTQRGHDGKAVDALVLEKLGLSGELPEALGGRTLKSIVDFEAPLKTRVISLAGNQLTGDAPADLVAGCHSVEVLNLSNNKLTGIAQTPECPEGQEKGAFNFANSLQWVDLSNNHITELKGRSVQRVLGLWGLLLKDNKIKVIHSGAISNLRLLHVLDLSGNPIETIEDGALDRLPTLKKLIAKNEPPLSDDLQAKLMSMVPVDCECIF